MERMPLKKKKRDVGGTILTVLFVLVCLFYLYPIILVFINAFKKESSINLHTFALPTGKTFAGLDNFVTGVTVGDYPFYKSLIFSMIITVLSVALILLCTSMAAWYISRVGSRFT